MDQHKLNLLNNDFETKTTNNTHRLKNTQLFDVTRQKKVASKRTPTSEMRNPFGTIPRNSNQDEPVSFLTGSEKYQTEIQETDKHTPVDLNGVDKNPFLKMHPTN